MTPDKLAARGRVLDAIRITRRTALLAVATGAGAALLAACGAAGGPSAPAGSATPPASTAAPPASNGAASVSLAPAAVAAAKPPQPKSGGTWKHAITADLDRLDPHLFTPVSTETSWLAFDRLTAYDQKLKPQPMLAETWDVNADYTQFKLNLRKGVTFHTGREMTSDDVKYSLLRPRDPKVLQAFLASISNWFSSIDTPDKYTVVIKSDTPRPGFFDGTEIFNIVDKETLEGPDAQTKLIGTGPFTFVEWSKGDHLTFAKNKGYWRAGRPYLEGVVVSVREPTSMSLQLESGALDSMKNPVVADFVRLKSDPKYQATVVPNSGTFFQIGMNTKARPFDDKRVRQAINYAMDRTRFAGTIFKGTSQPLDLPWSETSPAYDAAKNNTYPYDLDKAKALLKAAGGSSLEADILVNAAAGPQLLEFAQTLQAGLATIGVKLNVKNLQQPVWVDLIINKKPDYSGLWGAFDTLSNVQPGSLFGSIAWRTANNASNFEDDGWNRIVASVSAEADPAKQKTLYGQMNDYILDQAFTIPIGTNPVTVVTTQKVHGLDFLMHSGAVGFTNAWTD